MRLEFHPEALAKYQAAAAYYESRKPGLGIRFVETVEDAVRRITESPKPPYASSNPLERSTDAMHRFRAPGTSA